MTRMGTILLMVFCLVAQADLGHGTGTGGSGLVIEFIVRANTLVALLRQLPKPRQLLKREEIDQLEELIHTTHVSVVKGDLFDNTGAAVDARNAPDPQRPGHLKLELKESAWIGYLEKETQLSYRLVFHEYLRLLPKDDDIAQISSRLRFSEAELAAAQDALTNSEPPAPVSPQVPGFEKKLYSDALPAAGFEKVIGTSDGGYLAVGQSGGDAHGTKPPFQGWLAKIAADGSVAWKLDKPYTDPAGYFWEGLRTAVVLRNGKYWVGGYGSGTSGANGSFTGLISQLSADGAVEWQRQLAIRNGDVRLLGLSRSGEVYAAGGGGASADASNGWVGKIGADGQALWTVWLGPDFQHPILMVPSPQGGVRVFAGYRRGLVAEVSPTGAFKFTELGVSVPHAIAPANDGGYLILGEHYINTDLHRVCEVTRLDANGAKLWYHEITETICWSALALPDGQFLIGGNAGEAYAGRTTAELIKLDDKGAEAWRTSVRATTDLSDMILNSAGQFVLVGTSFYGDVGQGWIFESAVPATEFTPPATH